MVCSKLVATVVIEVEKERASERAREIWTTGEAQTKSETKPTFATPLGELC